MRFGNMVWRPYEFVWLKEHACIRKRTSGNLAAEQVRTEVQQESPHPPPSVPTWVVDSCGLCLALTCTTDQNGVKIS